MVKLGDWAAAVLAVAVLAAGSARAQEEAAKPLKPTEAAQSAAGVLAPGSTPGWRHARWVRPGS